jgi:hypothetical protein
MKPFWGKRENDATAKAGDTANGTENLSRPERRFTVGLARAEQLAIMLAQSRAAKFVEVADMLAGMYIYEWDRLSRFWDDRSDVEELLRGICSISPQRWHHWIELYHHQCREEEKELTSPWRRLPMGSRSFSGHAPDREATLEHSKELEGLLASAAQLSPFRDNLDGHPIPVLTSECVLLSIARNTESDLSRRLRETKLDLVALERAARDPRRAPHP